MGTYTVEDIKDWVVLNQKQMNTFIKRFKKIARSGQEDYEFTEQVKDALMAQQWLRFELEEAGVIEKEINKILEMHWMESYLRDPYECAIE
ncbi:MAG: hypothetical protein GY730_06145, partial [bacterium]|nr:hypothetical protein [bacterium]